MGRNRDLDHGPPMAPPDELTRLVDCHRGQPRSQPTRLPDRSEALPDNRPCRLNRLLRQIGVSANEVRDPGHGRAVAVDDGGKGVLVAGDGGANDGRLRRSIRCGGERHVHIA